MSHNLHIRAGKASMMYVGEVPWHRLGTRLDKPASAEQALTEAGLNFEVGLRPLRAFVRGNKQVSVAGHFASIRFDTNEILGVVGSRYVPVQNRDAFRFFDPLVGRDESIYHTAGVLGNGEKVWLLAKLPDYIRIGKTKDLVHKYLLLYNSHDGSSHIRIKLTPIRVVCNNTLSVALSGSDEEVRIKHTESAIDRLEDAHQVLGLSNQLYAELQAIFSQMSLRKVTDRQLLEYVKTLIPSNPEVNPTRSENIRKRILEIHESVDDARMHRGTLFGAYNAVTEMTDHFTSAKDANKHLRSIWWGGSERLKQRAFSLAKTML